MKQIKLNSKEVEALSTFKMIMFNHPLRDPISRTRLLQEVNKRGCALWMRSIRRLSEYCRRESPPFCVCFSSSVGGIWLAQTLEEAKPYIKDSGAKAFTLLQQRQNVFNHLRTASSWLEYDEIPEISIGGFQEELDLSCEKEAG